MADTIQVVRWSLGGDDTRSGYLSEPPGARPTEEVLQEAIERLGLMPRVRATFPITRPLWYGLWIDSPLTAEQCRLLRDLLTETARIVPRFQASIAEFSRALGDALETGEPLNVSLSAPGHVAMGWETTFVHCPRCKAEGPVERWRESYPDEPVDCPVCGHRYSPATTHSMQRTLCAETVRCRSCEAVQRVRDLPADEINTLEDRQTFKALSDELTWLRRVEAFYDRHPARKGKIKPFILRLLGSREPAVLNAMMAGTPLDQLEPALDGATQPDGPERWSGEDRAVIEYIEHHSFPLPQRRAFVEETVGRLRAELSQRAPVRCRRCGGELAYDKGLRNGW